MAVGVDDFDGFADFEDFAFDAFAFGFDDFKDFEDFDEFAEFDDARADFFEPLFWVVPMAFGDPDDASAWSIEPPF